MHREERLHRLLSLAAALLHKVEVFPGRGLGTVLEFQVLFGVGEGARGVPTEGENSLPLKGPA